MMHQLLSEGILNIFKQRIEQLQLGLLFHRKDATLENEWIDGFLKFEVIERIGRDFFSNDGGIVRRRVRIGQHSFRLKPNCFISLAPGAKELVGLHDRITLLRAHRPVEGGNLRSPGHFTAQSARDTEKSNTLQRAPCQSL